MPPTDADASTPPGAPPPPPPGGRPSYRELRRRPGEGHIGGVCAGVADYFDLDPIVVRIGAIALALAGPGVIVYVLMWIFVPAAHGPASRPPRVAGRPERNKQILGIILVVFALSILWGDWWAPIRHWMFPLALIGLGGWLLLRRDDDDLIPPVPPGGPWPWSPPAAPGVVVPVTGTTAAGALDDTLTGAPDPDRADTDVLDPLQPTDPNDPNDPNDTFADDAELPDPAPSVGWPGDPTAPPPWATPTPAAPVPPDPERLRRRRRRRTISGIVMGTLLLWTGIAALAGISLQTVLAVALCIIGIGFIVGAFFGGSWGLLFPAALVAFGLVVTSVVDVSLEGPVGHHEHTPLSIAELEDPYQVSMGELELDLTEMPAEDFEVEAEVGFGHLVVTVPLDATVEVITDVGTGGTRIFGVEDGGLGVTTRHTYEGVGEGGPDIVLDLEVGMGQIDVQRGAEAPVELR